jgi:hypothetical protein
MSGETVLNISGFGVPPYAARGLHQTLAPIDLQTQGQLQRSVNGTLVDLSLGTFYKYKSTITGNDQKPPACDGLWPGQQVTVECVAELCYVVGGTAQRAVVAGSSYDDGGFTFYRPSLVMMVTNFQTDEDEYGAVVSWTMELEER